MLQRAVYRFTSEAERLNIAPLKRAPMRHKTVRAYETPELAAFCWVASQGARNEVIVRETILLPANGLRLHDALENAPSLANDEEYLWHLMRRHVHKHSPLSVWAPSPHVRSHHVVLINLLHSEYHKVQVESRRIN